ncbi:MAG: hypothetical protein AB3N18_18730 [Allomuricauda sp.]
METFKSKRIKKLMGSILVSAMLILLATEAKAQEGDLLAFNLESEAPVYRSTLTNPKSDYLLKVAHDGQSDQLSALQQKVIDFDITQLEEYSADEPSMYKVMFNESNGSVFARYDSKGNLVSSMERHVNIKIPPVVSRKIAIQYPGWSFEKSIYSVRYNKNSNSVKNLKVFLKKERQKKTVKFVLDI